MGEKVSHCGCMFVLYFFFFHFLFYWQTYTQRVLSQKLFIVGIFSSHRCCSFPLMIIQDSNFSSVEEHAS